MSQTVEEAHPYTKFMKCPDCKTSIEYWHTSGMSECYPHFYCESCSNVIWRESDRDIVYASDLSENVVKTIVKTLPQCECGGSFKASANPKCPLCKYEFKHNDSVVDHLKDPYIILLQGASFINER